MTTYEHVGYSAGLRGRWLNRYVEYMKTRWGDTERSKCLDGYAFEWAERFNDGVDYDASDTGGKKILLAIDKRWIDNIYKSYEIAIDVALEETI